MEAYHTSKKLYRLWLFWLGVIATVSYRIIIILNNVSQFSVKIAWYVGTIGFFWYFVHRYRVQNYRENLVKEKQLMKKVAEKRDLSEDDREALIYVLKTLRSTKAKWNYIVIFVLSGIALIYGIITDFFL